MNKQFKNMIVTLGAAFLVAGLVFTPAALADTYYHFGGFYGNYVPYVVGGVESGHPGAADIGYDVERATLNVSVRDGSISIEDPFGYGEIDQNTAQLNVSQFPGVSDADVKTIIVDYNVSLNSSSGKFSNFSNAESFLYANTTWDENLGHPAVPEDAFGASKKLYEVNATNSLLDTDKSGSTAPMGEAFTVDTNWAFANQKVKIAVSPAPGYAVYGWNVYKGNNTDGQLLPNPEDYIVKSTDPEDGATTYILTMPEHAVTVQPMLRDQGTTIVTYVFLDADTYVMEIPADFNIKKANVLVDGKMVNITECELLAGHVLSVEMVSKGGYDGTNFVMQNIKDKSAIAHYEIGLKKIYLNETAFTRLYDNYEEILTTSGLGPAELDDLIEAGNMKTELGFTLVSVDSSVLGKYKDQLTFTVDITS